MSNECKFCWRHVCLFISHSQSPWRHNPVLTGLSEAWEGTLCRLPSHRPHRSGGAHRHQPPPTENHGSHSNVASAERYATKVSHQILIFQFDIARHRWDVIFIIKFPCQIYWSIDWNISELFRNSLMWPGPEFSRPSFRSKEENSGPVKVRLDK